MVPTWYRCRKCRAYLFTDEHLDRLDDPETSRSEDQKTGQVYNTDCCCSESLYFVKLEGCPVWVNSLLEKGQFLKGKLYCPKCSGRVGSFDFVCKTTCDCGKHTLNPIHIVKTRVDEFRNKRSINVPALNVSTVQRHKFQVVTTMEEAGVLKDDVKDTNTSGMGESASSIIPDPKTVLENNELQASTEKQMHRKFTKAVQAPLVSHDVTDNTTDPRSDKCHSLEPEFSEAPGLDIDEHTCPICLDIFYHPYSCKPCQHIFCGPCLRRLAASKDQNSKCPLCRKTIVTCLPNYDMTKLIRKNYPQGWHLRHNAESKVKRKLPPLPGTGIQRRRDRLNANKILSQSAGVVFVALFFMLIIAVTIAIASFAASKVYVLFKTEIYQVICSINNIVDSSWNWLMIVLFEKKNSQEKLRAVARALNDVSKSIKSIYNRTS